MKKKTKQNRQAPVRRPLDDARVRKTLDKMTPEYRKLLQLDKQSVLELARIKRTARKAGNTAINNSCVVRALLWAVRASDLEIGGCRHERGIREELKRALQGRRGALTYHSVHKDEFDDMMPAHELVEQTSHQVRVVCRNLRRLQDRIKGRERVGPGPVVTKGPAEILEWEFGKLLQRLGE
jgi:hypothetical protein